MVNRKFASINNSGVLKFLKTISISTATTLLILIISMSSCSLELTKGLKRSGKAVLTRNDLFPLFRKSGESMLFNMQIVYKSNNFGGLLVIKPTGDAYRAVFNSHFGMSIFDFEFTPDGFHVHKCIDFLNRKTIINTLENDMRNMLYVPEVENRKAIVYKSETDPNIEAVKVGKNLFLKNNASKQLKAMEFPRFVGSLRYSFENHIDGFPETINIKHANIGLTLKLNKIDKKQAE